MTWFFECMRWREADEQAYRGNFRYVGETKRFFSTEHGHELFLARLLWKASRRQKQSALFMMAQSVGLGRDIQ